MSHLLLYLDTESLIRYGGLSIICLMVFCSVGLFFCFFLPVGGVLFALGIIAATGNTLPPVMDLCLLLSLSCLAGSLAAYGIGRSTGQFFYTRKETRFFRRSYLTSTEEFYTKYGPLAMIGGYFLPIIRTFAPILAGIIKLKFQRFLIFNLVGSVIFTSSFILTGYLIGNVPFLQPWLKYIIGVFLLTVTVPLIVKTVRAMMKPRES